jgi:hypothetical protein
LDEGVEFLDLVQARVENSFVHQELECYCPISESSRRVYEQISLSYESHLTIPNYATLILSHSIGNDVATIRHIATRPVFTPELIERLGIVGSKRSNTSHHCALTIQFTMIPGGFDTPVAPVPPAPVLPAPSDADVPETGRVELEIEPVPLPLNVCE